MKFPRLFAIPTDVAPDQRRLLFLLGAAFFISQYDMTLLSLALPDVQATFGVAEQDLGSMIAMVRLGGLPAILLTLWADQAGRRRLLIVSLLGLSVAAVATGLAQTPRQFILFLFLARLFSTLDEIIAIILALEMLPPQRRGWGVGFISAMGGLGSGLSALLYGAVDYLPGGWRALYVFGGVAVLFVAWMRRDLPESRMYSESTREAGFLAPLKQLLRDYRRETVGIALVAAFFWFPMSAALNFMSKHLQDAHNYSPGEVSTLFLVAGVAAIFGNVVAGRLSDRFGRRPMLALAILVNTGSFLVFYNVGGGVLLPLAWIFGLFTYFAGEVIISAVSGELFPTTCRSTASTMRTIFAIFGGVTGLVVEGWLYSALGSHAAALSCMVFVSLLALPLIYSMLTETANKPLS